AISLFHPGLITYRVSKMIEPGSLVEAKRVHNQGVSVPPADGVPHPCRLRIFRKLAAICPDLAICVPPFKVLQNSIRCLDKLHRVNRDLEEQVARHTNRIASHHGVIPEPARYGAL